MIKYISNNESNGKSKNEIIRPDALLKIDFIKKKKKGKTSILVFCKKMQYCENELSRLLQNREIAIFGARQNRTVFLYMCGS